MLRFRITLNCVILELEFCMLLDAISIYNFRILNHAYFYRYLIVTRKVQNTLKVV